MAATNWTLIASSVLSSSSGSFSFSSIPQTYQDLIVWIRPCTTNPGGGWYDGQLNTQGTGGMSGEGGYVAGAPGSFGVLSGEGGTFRFPQSSNGGVATFRIRDYTRAGSHAIQSESGGIGTNFAGNNSIVEIHDAYDGATSAVTAIYFTPYSSSSFQSGSTFYLYGIVKS